MQKVLLCGRRVKIQMKSIFIKNIAQYLYVLTIRKMLGRLVRYIHPDIAYKGKKYFVIILIMQMKITKRWRSN